MQSPKKKALLALQDTRAGRRARSSMFRAVPQARANRSTGTSSFQRYQMVMPATPPRTQCTTWIHPHKEMERRCSKLSAPGDVRCSTHGGKPRKLKVRTHGKLVPLPIERAPVLLCDR